MHSYNSERYLSLKMFQSHKTFSWWSTLTNMEVNKFSHFSSWWIVNNWLVIAGVRCGIPPDGAFTREVPQEVLVYQERFTYTCVTGYVTDEPTTTECQADGTFTLTTPPECSSKSVCALLTKNYFQYVFSQLYIWGNRISDRVDG